ncbi:MAG TPA: hypothetical protein VOB72_14395 [Candidatus Dormibacteraeota bacterium]|nr:hypothetical protein [Candidatus Dormibacteraeota bacterium]
MARFRLFNSVLLAVVLAVGLTLTATGSIDPDGHECPPGCAGVPTVSATR